MKVALLSSPQIGRQIVCCHLTELPPSYGAILANIHSNLAVSSQADLKMLWMLQIFDGSAQIAELGQASGAASKEKVARPKPLFAHQHRDEGFALDWSRLSHGRLASGDNKASLYVWDPSSNASSWSVKQYKVCSCMLKELASSLDINISQKTDPQILPSSDGEVKI